VPPFSTTGGDLVDQVRDWLDRQRERFTASSTNGRSGTAERRPVRRGPLRTQAVPLGTARAMPPGGRPPRGGRPGRNDRAGRGAYTLILGTVLVVGVIALFFGVNMALETMKGPAPTPTPAVATGVTPLPNPAAQSSPPPFVVPSPSPSPTLAPPQQRTHTVEGGDTLNRIAQRYGVTVEAIMQANGFTDRNRILRIGERLIIPDTPPASPVPVPR
jgi:LysM repeat protein